MIGSNGQFDDFKKMKTIYTFKIGLQRCADIVSILSDTVSFLHTFLVNYFAVVVKQLNLLVIKEDFSKSILADYFHDQTVQPKSAIPIFGTHQYVANAHTDKDKSLTYGFCFQEKGGKRLKVIFSTIQIFFGFNQFLYIYF